MEGDRHGLELKKKMKKVGFFEFQCYSTQITEKNKQTNKQTNKKTKQKWLVLPGEICFLSSSQLYRSTLCVDKATK